MTPGDRGAKETLVSRDDDTKNEPGNEPGGQPGGQPGNDPDDPPQNEPAGGADDWKSPESKASALADLRSERTKRQTLEEELTKYRQAEEQRRQEQMSEQERALEAARAEAAEAARTETRTEVNTRLFAAEVKAAAAGKVADPDLLTNPEVAKTLLGLDDVPLTKDGDVDAEVISAKLDDLVERKPYLAPGEKQRTPQIDTGQGRRENQPPDLGSMSPSEYIRHRRNRSSGQ